MTSKKKTGGQKMGYDNDHRQ